MENQIEMVPVTSTNILAVGYDKVNEEMHISFKNGTYIYSGVPETTYKALVESSSKGQFFHSYIKPKHAIYRKKV